MKTKVTDMSPMAYARIAGVLYLIITVAAIFAHFIVPDQLIVAGDAAATAKNILASESMFRLGAIGGELVVLLSEIVLSVILYVLLKPVNKTLSLVAAVSRLAMILRVPSLTTALAGWYHCSSLLPQPHRLGPRSQPSPF